MSACGVSKLKLSLFCMAMILCFLSSCATARDVPLSVPSPETEDIQEDEPNTTDSALDELENEHTQDDNPDTEHGAEYEPEIADIQEDTVHIYQGTTVEFSTFELYRKFSNESGDFIELDLRLPKLTGDFAGIPIINEFFLEKEQQFYDELDIGGMLQSLEEDREIYPREGVMEGLSGNWGRVAYYELAAFHENIVSIYAWLWGGLGGVSWLGMEGHVFDLDTGKRLELSDIFAVSEEYYLKLIYDYVSRDIAENLLDPEYEDAYWFDDVDSGLGYETIRQFDPNDFYLADHSIVVFYPKYTFSSGAAGLSLNIFEIPYNDIGGALAIRVAG